MPIAPRKKLPRISKAEAIATGKKYYFDPRKAQHAVDFFENFLIHSKGQFAGEPFILLPWQKHDIIEELFGWMRVDTDTRKYRVGYISVPKKNGKDLDIETPVLTTSGWKTIGTLAVGDEVFHPSGRPVKVVAKSEVFTDVPQYRMGFSQTDEEIIAGAPHLWKTRYHNSVGTSREVAIRETEEIAATLKRPAGNNHSIEINQPLQFPYCSDLPVDPYVLGYWLGDGTSATGDVTIGSQDMTESVETLADCGVSLKKKKPRCRVLVKGMAGKLRELGLKNNKCIPDAYKFSSIEQRLSLLQGLMDTDGTVSMAGQCELSLCRKPLAEDALFLIRSLGFKANMLARPAKLYGRETSTRYRIHFTPSPGDVVFRLPRKQARLSSVVAKKNKPRSKTRQITKCEPTRQGLSQCIQVSADDGMFLAGKSLIPTHNSTLLSGISLYTLIADGEPAAECFGAANSREQADILFRTIKELVEASPELKELLEIVDSRKHIACVPTNSFWKVISSDAGRQEGHNIHSCVVDEIHQAKDRKLWAALRYGGIARKQSLIVAITTAGSNIDSICYELNEHALKCMQDPEFDEQFFGYVTGATLEDDYRDPEVWRAANPSYGETMDEASFISDLKDAEGSKTKLADFLRYRLNVWVAGENKFVDLEKWEKCKRAYPPPGIERLWYCGLDLAQTWDVNAFVAVSKAREGDVEVFDVYCRFWIPEKNAEKRRENVPYILWAQEFEKSGLVLTPGDSCDYDFIKREILDFCKSHSVQKIACDPHNAHHIQNQLQEQGVNMVAFNQAPSSMNGPVKLLDTLISQGRLRTGNNPILNVHASNCVVKTNAEGYVKIMKPSAMSPNRVDGMVALAMALWMANDAPGSVQLQPRIFML